LGSGGTREAVDTKSSSPARRVRRCAVVKLMLCLAYQDLPLGVPLAGEL
jgi:hypothetical protein